MPLRPDVLTSCLVDNQVDAEAYPARPQFAGHVLAAVPGRSLYLFAQDPDHCTSDDCFAQPVTEW